MVSVDEVHLCGPFARKILQRTWATPFPRLTFNTTDSVHLLKEDAYISGCFERSRHVTPFRQVWAYGSTRSRLAVLAVLLGAAYVNPRRVFWWLFLVLVMFATAELAGATVTSLMHDQLQCRYWAERQDSDETEERMVVVTF